MARRRRCADRAAQNWQVMARAKPRGLLQASSLATRPEQLMAKSQATRSLLFLAQSRTKVTLLALEPGKPPPLAQQALEIPLVRVHAHRYLQGPDPFAFSRGISDDQKHNRAVRCGDSPIFVRYRLRYNRRGFVGYGNRRSHSLHKRARPARTFPMAGAGKCPFPLRPIQD